MNLNINGFQLKLYQWFYQTDSLPTNFCPYFWKIVWLYIVLIPYTIAVLPYHTINHFAGKSERDSIPAIGAFGIGIILWVLIGCTLGMITVWFTDHALVKGFAVGGFGLVVLTIIIYISEKIKFYRLKRADRKYAELRDKLNAGETIKPTKRVLIKEAFNAWYEKHCPRIDWK